MSLSPVRRSFSSCFSFVAPPADEVVADSTVPHVEPPAVVVVNKKKRGRKKKWNAHVLTEQDVHASRAFVKKYGRDATAKQRVIEEYTIFVHKNSLDAKDALEACVGQMLASGLKASTIDTYTGYIAAKFPSASNRLIRRACQSAHADMDVEGAPRFPRSFLKECINRFANPLVRKFSHQANVLGWRPVAGQRSRPKNTRLTLKKHIQKLGVALVCQIPWDKNVQKRSQRQHLRLPLFMVEDLYNRSELEDIFSFSGDGSDPVFADVTTSMVNAAFRAVCEADRPPTSYSSRRAYIQEAFEKTNGDREKLRDITLHFTDQLVRAHYVE